jgi:hypothetical protein
MKGTDMAKTKRKVLDGFIESQTIHGEVVPKRRVPTQAQIRRLSIICRMVAETTIACLSGTYDAENVRWENVKRDLLKATNKLG